MKNNFLSSLNEITRFLHWLNVVNNGASCLFFVCIKITCEITCQSGQSLHTLPLDSVYWRQQNILWHEEWKSILKIMGVLNGSLMQIVNNVLYDF